MKQIGAQFTDKQILQLDDLSSSIGLSRAKIARAAMQIGLKMIREHNEDDCSSGFSQKEYVVMNELKALN